MYDQHEPEDVTWHSDGKCDHSVIPTPCSEYLRSEGYDDIRDDQCCICYFEEDSV